MHFLHLQPSSNPRPGARPLVLRPLFPFTDRIATKSLRVPVIPYSSVRKPYQCHRGSLLLRPFPCRTHERPLVVLQLLHCIHSHSLGPAHSSQLWLLTAAISGSNGSSALGLFTFSWMTESTAVIVIPASNVAVPYSLPVARVIDGFH